MDVFLSRKKQKIGTKIDFARYDLECILICSDKHTMMIEQAIQNNAKSNKHYEQNKRLYVHYVDKGEVVNVTSHV